MWTVIYVIAIFVHNTSSTWVIGISKPGLNYGQWIVIRFVILKLLYNIQVIYEDIILIHNTYICVQRIFFK